MRLTVHHETQYHYSANLAYSAQRLYLTPLNFDSQKVLSWTIEAPGIENALRYIDGFGNVVHLATVQNHKGPVTVIARGVVECTDSAGVLHGLPEVAPAAVYLRQTSFTMPSAAIRALSDKAVADHQATLEHMHTLMDSIHRKVSFEPGTTDSYTTAAQAFAAGRGVCQDHTHILLGATRFLGIPCRYVTGYLVTGIGASSAASHAWVEALIPSLGWVGFDPTNNKCPTDHYVRVAAGIDATSVAPIRGSRRGGGEGERMHVEVSVQIDQQ